VRLVIGISGASGVIYGIRLLQVLRDLNVETHLIMTNAAKETIRLETDYQISEVESLATKSYNINDIAAPMSSGSFKFDGMIIVPCSMKTLAGIATGYTSNLLLRAADVTLKERRPLILVLRETPLTVIHIRNMLTVAKAGGIILPAMPGFYHNPKTLQDMIDFIVGKILDQLKLEHNLYERWQGPQYKIKTSKTTSTTH
jgi:polyprenyl P-hydroxybenzoate/phenylacrylic acid decarboxylase-like protein